MEEIQFSNFRDNMQHIIESLMCSKQPVLISDRGKLLFKIVPVAPTEKKTWLGCMKGRGEIIGDIISPAESADAWEVLSE